jgi:hypothetical protein
MQFENMSQAKKSHRELKSLVQCQNEKPPVIQMRPSDTTLLLMRQVSKTSDIDVEYVSGDEKKVAEMSSKNPKEFVSSDYEDYFDDYNDYSDDEDYEKSKKPKRKTNSKYARNKKKIN